LISNTKLMIAHLREKGMLKDISFADVLQELSLRPLCEAETVCCLRWWIDVSRQGENPDLLRLRTDLLNTAVLATSDINTQEERILPLAKIQTFLDPRNKVIPTDGPLPDDLLPISVGRNFDSESLLSVFPWRELSIIDWVRHIADPSVCAKSTEFDLNNSAIWAEKVLQVLARVWPNLSRPAIADIVLLFKNKTCVPTPMGMKVPEESYFSSAAIFHDLPVVSLTSGAHIKSPLAKVLEALGVRKHVDLQVIFYRVVKTGDWTICDLIKYLASVQSTLTPEEFERLQMTAAFPKERSETDGDSGQNKVSRCRASDLYEPLEIFRELGLPVIDWGTQQKWKGTSEEG